MAVPAHDQRDLDFARRSICRARRRRHDGPLTGAIPVIEFDEDGVPIEPEIAGPSLDDLDPAVTGVALTGDGRLVNSGPLDGLSKRNAIARVIAQLEEAGTGRAAKNYRLRDWLISRQRFWGTPIPMVHREDGTVAPVPDAELPVRLPAVDGLDLLPKGQSPLGAAEEWVATVDPETGAPARRDPDTMDTFVDSSWYFLRSSLPEMRRRPSPPPRRIAGVPSTSTSAASSTRSCTCSTRASSRRRSTTCASSTSRSPSRASSTRAW